MPDTDRADAAVATRTIVVEPPSKRREALLVARAVFHIVFWSAVVIALERGDVAITGRLGMRPTAPASGDFAGAAEVALGSLDATDQALFGQIGSAVPELESVRSAMGAWPSVEELARRNVAPFAASTGGYRWRLLRENLATNYVGLPDAGSGRPTVAIAIVEPEPGAPADPRAPSDEIHHRLADGTMLHVSIWRAPGVRALERPLASPAAEDGWQRVTAAKR